MLREGIAPFTGADIVDPALAIVPCARVPITACTLGEAAREMVRLATSELALGLAVHLCNAYTLALADKDPAYRAMLRRASLNFPDGTPVAWANRLLHRGLALPRDRVRGADLFLKTFELGRGAAYGTTCSARLPTCSKRCRPACAGASPAYGSSAPSHRPSAS